jgi:hypothetical protein
LHVYRPSVSSRSSSSALASPKLRWRDSSARNGEHGCDCPRDR